MKLLKTPLALLAAAFAALIMSSSNAGAQSQGGLTVTNFSVPIPAREIRIGTLVSGDPGASMVPMVAANVKAETSAKKITKMEVRATADSAVTTFYLFDGSTLLAASGATSSGYGVFDLNTVIAADTSKTLVIRADLAHDAPTIAPIVSVDIRSIEFEQPNGDKETMNVNVHGSYMHPVYKGANFLLVSAPTLNGTTNTDGTTRHLFASFQYNVSAFGGNVEIPEAADYLVSFVSVATGVARQADSVSVVTIPNSPIADGSVSTVAITASINAAKLDASGLYFAKVTRVAYQMGTVKTYRIWGLEDAVTGVAAAIVDPQGKMRISEVVRNGTANELALTAVVEAGNFYVEKSVDLTNWTSVDTLPGGGQIGTQSNGMRIFKLIVPMIGPKQMYRVKML